MSLKKPLVEPQVFINTPDGKSLVFTGYLQGLSDLHFSEDDEEYAKLFEKKMKELKRKVNISDQDFLDVYAEQTGYARGFLGKRNPFERR